MILHIIPMRDLCQLQVSIMVQSALVFPFNGFCDTYLEVECLSVYIHAHPVASSAWTDYFVRRRI